MSGIQQWLAEYIKADEPVIGKEAATKRVTALKEMFSGWRHMTADQFTEVMTTAHFTNYFSDALSRMFYDAYRLMGSQWRDYVFMDTAPDFRDVDRFRMSEPGTLYRRREKAEAKATSVAETLISYGVEEFARQFDVSWQVIVNDDLGAIAQVPQRMLLAARRFEDSFVSNLYDNATTQAALVALGANFAGTGRLSEAALATGVQGMMQRTDTAGNTLAFPGVWLVIPPVSEITARKILESAQVAGSMDNDKNVIPQFIRGYKIDPYITTSGADRPWYLVADPSAVPTITVVRLQGFPNPVVYRKRSNIDMIQGNVPAPFLLGSFETGDIEYAVEDVIGGWDDATYGGVTDQRGIFYSSGTTG